MKRSTPDEQLLIRYLLGELPEAECIELEQLCLESDEVFEQLEAVEAELTDDYVRGVLVGHRRKEFEKRLLNTPGRAEEIELARFIASDAHTRRTLFDGLKAWVNGLGLPTRFRQIFISGRSEYIPALISCALAITGIAILWRVSIRDARANAFVDVAVETHRQQLAGHLPLELRTNSPVQMSTWFVDKVPFQFRLPASQETAGQPQRYELTGGRLLNFRGTRAAYIAYRMQAQVISLVVTSASTSVASGGKKTISKSLTFHTHRRGELQVVTWSVHNLTYALVSGVNVPASHSCAVCHASAQERDLIQDLRSLNKRRTNRGEQMRPSDADIRRLVAFR